MKQNVFYAICVFAIGLVTTSLSAQWSGTTDIYYNGGKVGIGTATPANNLHVVTVDGASNVPLKMETTGTDSISGLSLKNDARNWHFRVDGTDGDKFKIFDSNVASYRFTINTSGDVGIGTTSPAAKLDVVGDVLVSGTLTANQVIGAVYQDFAEWVPASSDLEPGTVVVLNKGNINEVMRSQRSYDTSVAGVVSAQPGIILGVGSATKEQIATTGRVHVKVDARKEPVEVGDLLVTSDEAGYAMRSMPVDIAGVTMHRPGTIVGKALEPLAEGVGEILVLLSLQ